MDSSHGSWSPLAVEAAVDLFRPAEFRWWVAGGHALELHLGRSWRSHDDTDVSFCRADASAVFELLDGWDLQVAAAGVLSPWSGRPLKAEAHENNLWARPSPDAPWALDMTISDGNDDRWIYRRNQAVSRSWGHAVLLDPNGHTPYLAPELQLLFKSVNVRPKDQIDADEVIPNLTSDRAGFLFDGLPNGHEWRALARRP